MATLKSSVLS